MHSYYICVPKCENKSTSESERASVCRVRECVLSREGGATCKRQMVTQWSCSPTPSLFLAPFWVRHLFPVTSPESYLICFFGGGFLFRPQHLLSSHPSLYYLKSQLRSSLTLLSFYLFKPPFLPFPSSSASLSGFLLKKST